MRIFAKMHWFHEKFCVLGSFLMMKVNLSMKQILEIERIHRFSNPMVLEGGSIHVDGEGLNSSLNNQKYFDGTNILFGQEHFWPQRNVS